MTRTPNFRRWIVAEDLWPKRQEAVIAELLEWRSKGAVVILASGLYQSIVELYRLWRQFRERNFDAQTGDPLFVPEMEKVEARLFAASRLIDDSQLSAAGKELQAAFIQLQAVRQRQPAAKPANR